MSFASAYILTFWHMNYYLNSFSSAQGSFTYLCQVGFRGMKCNIWSLKWIGSKLHVMCLKTKLVCSSSHSTHFHLANWNLLIKICFSVCKWFSWKRGGYKSSMHDIYFKYQMLKNSTKFQDFPNVFLRNNGMKMTSNYFLIEFYVIFDVFKFALLIQLSRKINSVSEPMQSSRCSFPTHALNTSLSVEIIINGCFITLFHVFIFSFSPLKLQ